jgi:hypothetical protein
MAVIGRRFTPALHQAVPLRLIAELEPAHDRSDCHCQ